jgi:ABC-type transport system substrate-binding protein
MGTTAGSEVPDPNGTVSFVEGASSGFSFDPETAASLNGYPVFASIYDRLIQLTGDNKLAPMLATSWKWNSTDTQLTMDLRTDVKFHDGSSFNADVAVANIKAVAAPGSVGAVTLSTMTDVAALNPSTIQLSFSQPNPAVLYLFTGFGGMMVSPNAVGKPNLLKTQFFGSGPYNLVSVSSSLTYTMDRVNGYWDKTHVYPRQMLSVNIPNEVSRLNAVKTGAADATYISALTYPSAASDKSLQVVKESALETFDVFMNNKIAPFNNPQVRMAVNLAIDRAAVDASQNNLCPPSGQSLPDGVPGYLPSVKPTTDVAKAKQMIQAAGASGDTVAILNTSIEPNLTISKIVQANLDAIGLNVKIDTVASNVSRQMFSAGAAPLLLQTEVINGGPDPSAYFDLYVLSAADNPGTPDPQLVSMIKSAEKLPLGSQARTTAFQGVSRYLVANPIWAPICQPANLFVANKQVIGLNTMPNASLTTAPNTEYLQIATSK